MLPTDTKLDLFACVLAGGPEGGRCNVDELPDTVTIEGLEGVFFQDFALEVNGEELANIVPTESKCRLCFGVLVVVCVRVCVNMCECVDVSG